MALWAGLTQRALTPGMRHGFLVVRYTQPARGKWIRARSATVLIQRSGVRASPSGEDDLTVRDVVDARRRLEPARLLGFREDRGGGRRIFGVELGIFRGRRH